MSDHETMQRARRWRELDEQIECLDEEREFTAAPFERAARQLDKAQLGHERNGSFTLRAIDAELKTARFDVIDSYDDHFEERLTFALADLADVDAACERLQAQRARTQRDETLRRRQALQRQLAALGRDLDERSPDA